MRRLRVLALSPVPHEGASARFRIYQYVPEFRAAGVEMDIQPFFTPDFFRVVYAPGRRGVKARLFIRETLARLALLLRRQQYDLYLVHREAFPIGPPWVEWMLARTGRPIVFDFDDAIFLPNASDANRMIRGLKSARKTRDIVRWSAAVVAGNEYLGAWARRINPATTVISTSVDTEVFAARTEVAPPERTPRIGWIGSHSTGKYLDALRDVLARVASEQAFSLYVVGSDRRLRVPDVEVVHRPWALAREPEDFAGCDIGVYPLTDDEWTRGKCAFKAIQFMACGVPVVASPVGANCDLIQDGVNGFLAATPNEWVEKLGWLLSDDALRDKLGQAGRRTVEERYARAVNGPRLVDVVLTAATRGGRVG